MFAVIKTGGKQYKVAPRDIIKIEKLPGNPGDAIEFTEVLAAGSEGEIHMGTPLLANARVKAKVVDQIRDDKVIIFKKNRRHNYRRKNGHRQYLTVIEVTDILSSGLKPAKKSEAKETSPAQKPSPAAKKAESPVSKRATPTKESASGTPEKKTAAKTPKS